MERDLHILPRLSDSICFLYLEYVSLEREDSSLIARNAQGIVEIPIATLSTLMLGPGTTVTHGAMVVLAECRTSVVWAGQSLHRFYASGGGRTRSSDTIERQVRSWADPVRRRRVVERMYRLRFPDPLPAGLSLEQIRGREGVRVRDAYARAAREHGVAWSGRNYDRSDWKGADPVNRALSAGAACLYGVCHAGVSALGYSPALGFIHVGKQLSFVYDVADLYKTQYLIPAAFSAAKTSPDSPESAVRRQLNLNMGSQDLLLRLARDLERLFSVDDCTGGTSSEFDAHDAPGAIWSDDRIVEGGKNYGGDCS